ncbi:PREDICTED: uncharacterized protein LOC109172248 isoform X2 [Ipomoea nil]|uniref:uncharacterized protein LOC109172248 isoform X2 n=1 Tax=Ipomoea nil TaxID=35883 RepID=UPI00090119EC|nr:PREDICTED: uncharacterized protein LOC109172248 isoform X2 [Ipomoea nil]
MDPPSDFSFHTATNDTEDNKNDRGKTRDVTSMKKWILTHSSEKGKEVVEFKGNNPIGAQRNYFLSYICHLACSKVSILFRSWKEVPPQTLEMIWHDLLTVFDIPNTPAMRKRWLSYAGVRWRDFKASLSSRFIYGDKQNKNPCDECSYIDQDTWDEFVAAHKDSKFQTVRKQAHLTQSNHVYEHRLSRGGYYKLDVNMMDEKLKERREVSMSDPLIVVNPPSPPCRHGMWKRARVDKTKAFITEESKLIAKKIDSFEQQCTPGEFIESGRMDILALEKKEHSTCVRGVGREVGISDSFGSTPPCEGYTSVEAEALKDMISAAISKGIAENTAVCKQFLENAMAEATASFRKLSAYLDQKNNLCVQEPAPDLNSDNASSPDPLENIPMVGVRCLLYLENPIRRKVAVGKVFGMGHTLHVQMRVKC